MDYYTIKVSYRVFLIILIQTICYSGYSQIKKPGNESNPSPGNKPNSESNPSIERKPNVESNSLQTLDNTDELISTHNNLYLYRIYEPYKIDSVVYNYEAILEKANKSLAQIQKPQSENPSFFALLNKTEA